MEEFHRFASQSATTMASLRINPITPILSIKKPKTQGLLNQTDPKTYLSRILLHRNLLSWTPLFGAFPPQNSFSRKAPKAEFFQESFHSVNLISRRALISSFPIGLAVVSPGVLQARERRNRKNIPLEDYQTSADGLKYFDLVEGNGLKAEKGSTVRVHFDCIYRGITAVSSRESKLLAGKERKREYVDNANGLFSAQAAPKPPPAMYSITEGMKVGGKVNRTVILPPEAGYGQKGMNEIPPGATFDLNVELLDVLTPPTK
ncbi:peptidyl-prolyl cis-trans isomerase FKBP18, chloroplastic isoform X3 [Amborella trichopoda]|uniref:peptidyl-prolyl cis-trans isomerase FKBP18, chloroplastic isoform X3 n=1 Tax=Amborella trichopoda TaxID=13333 RepID=UPI0009BDFABD|nr:peptidyl-prolyl cis-trans isomerase FKBP18, chloroplastic isoform X3 [Amborella trichopoda]|eukprot:XP_020529973.1 peptidyl-prolyl cis-trans isomerase FKBP18, chloroplastic isoform X3 [Amborella trichopoda]